jgi:hypothetical protein
MGRADSLIKIRRAIGLSYFKPDHNQTKTIRLRWTARHALIPSCDRSMPRRGSAEHAGLDKRTGAQLAVDLCENACIAGASFLEFARAVLHFTAPKASSGRHTKFY